MWSFIVKIICILNICNYAVAGKLMTTSNNDSDDDTECACAEQKTSSTNKRLEALERLFKENRVLLCGAGMQDFRIADDQISSSEYWNSVNNAAHSHVNGRLYKSTGVEQAFCGMLGDVDKWVQVDMKRDVQMTGVVTQGRPNVDQWVTLFNVQYKPEEADDFVYVENDNNQNSFAGNFDRNTLSITSFSTPVVGRFFRINILEWKSHTCMRFDFLVC